MRSGLVAYNEWFGPSVPGYSVELIRGRHNLRARHHGCAVTIGNFDGVHLGHQAVIRQLAERAREWHAPSCVVTFEPHPREYFAPAQAPVRLSRLRDKVAALRRLGVDRLLVLRFDRRLVEQSPADFVAELLIRELGARQVVVGDDFRFGRGRAGDFSLLAQMGADHGFAVERATTFSLDGERVSSTRVRAALAAGDMAGAARLLGGPYTIRGRVVHGEKLGRDLGYPTANLPLRGHQVPVTGVFAVVAWSDDGRTLPCVASLGWRPTVAGTVPLLEVHAFDFAGDLYGAHLAVALLERLRPEVRFDSLAELTEQMHRDAAAARACLQHHEGARRDGTAPPLQPGGN